jgi:predicted 3-demethylubiquinone-9 3-methyltransferase (glyoxalase superfamily)
MNNPIYPCLWFNNKAGAAAAFYCSVFKNSEVLEDSPIVVTFLLAGQKFMGLNGGSGISANPSISFSVICENFNEIEYTFQVLLAGGNVLIPLDKYEWSEKYCWVQDKFGISWQLMQGDIQDTQKISPTLMFTNEYAGKAEEAVRFYTSIFSGSSILGILKYGENENEFKGYVKQAMFTLGGHVFNAKDTSVPHSFSFNEGISFVVNCSTQNEIDYYWDKLSAVPEAEQCGWLKDKFGISWQIVPVILPKLMKDPSKSERVTRAYLQMKKFEIDKLVNA